MQIHGGDFSGLSNSARNWVLHDCAWLNLQNIHKSTALVQTLYWHFAGAAPNTEAEKYDSHNGDDITPSNDVTYLSRF